MEGAPCRYLPRTIKKRDTLQKAMGSFKWIFHVFPLLEIVKRFSKYLWIEIILMEFVACGISITSSETFRRRTPTVI